MNLEITRQPTHAVVKCADKIDSRTAPELQTAIAPVLKDFSTVVLDLQDVTYMSSAGLRVLLLMHRQLTAKHGRAVLVGLSESLTEIMRITGFLQFFETHPSLADVKF